MSYFVECAPDVDLDSTPTIDHAEAALAYSQLLRLRGETELALEYALWAARAKVERAQAS